MANQKPSSKAFETHLFEALVIAQIPSLKSYTAVQEVRHMAGENISAELNAKFEVLSSKIDSTRWMMGSLLALVAIAAAGGVAIGVAILNYLFQIASSH